MATPRFDALLWRLRDRLNGRSKEFRHGMEVAIAIVERTSGLREVEERAVPDGWEVRLLGGPPWDPLTPDPPGTYSTRCHGTEVSIEPTGYVVSRRVPGKLLEFVHESGGHEDWQQAIAAAEAARDSDG